MTTKLPPLLISLHIPKTAGTTFHNMLNRVYGIKHIRVPNSGGGIDAIKRTSGKLRLDEMLCVSGHMSYGLHEVLGSREYQYITFLREPIERLLSYFFYIKGKKSHSQYGWTSKMSFSTWIRSDRICAHDNEMTRFLAGRSDVNTLPPKKPVTKADFDKAIQNMSGFAFVGLQEDFENGIVYLAELLNWPGVPREERRWLSTGHRIRKEQLHPSVIEYIQERHKWDIRLYEIGRKMYQERYGVLYDS